MKITYHSHSCFQIDGEHHSIIIDPFITDNPLSKITPEDIKVDTILVTHGHFDHVG
ncbi:MAG: MBL fold metallo-hydrolase, partial [Deltaproteobacteria bacterium]|nr:MBL fold metallo-hydrolase [Deltaproteobacteria bacterium]